MGLRPLGFSLSLYEEFCPTPYIIEKNHLTPKAPHKQINTHANFEKKQLLWPTLIGLFSVISNLHTYNVTLITIVTFDFVSTFSFEDNSVNFKLNMMDKRQHDFNTCWG
jgi:hypothetical protein